MPEYGDVIYNIDAMMVSALASDNSFGTPALVEYQQDFPIEFEADTDMIKSSGMIVETLAVVTRAMGTLKEASFNMDSKSIITGSTESESGTTPTRVNTTDFKFGGAGLPYFGLLVAGASITGNVIIGFPKCKLETFPSWTIDQNKFRLGEAKVNMLAPSTIIRSAMRVRRYETDASLPADASAWDTWFAGMFDS